MPTAGVPAVKQMEPRRVTRRAAALVLLIIGLLGLLPAAPAAAQPRDVFVVGTVGDLASLNPLISAGSVQREAYALIYDTLTGYAGTPGLARDWTASADGRTWRYRLRPGLAWSDGRPLTARDVAYTLNRARTGPTAGLAAYRDTVAPIVSVAAPDDATVVISTRAPTPALARIPVPILPEHVWRTIDAGELAQFTNAAPLGSGPFRLVGYEPRQLRFAPNPGHVGSAPRVREVVLRVYPTEAALAEALRAGTVDFARSLTTDVIDEVRSQPGVTALVSRTAAVAGLGVNLTAGHPALRDPVVRQAIAHALDGQEVVDAALGGYGEPAAGVLSRQYEPAVADPDRLRHDPARANALLDGAGYARGADGVRGLAQGGPRLVLRLLGRAGDPVSEDTVRLAAASLAKVGIRVELRLIPAGALAGELRSSRYDLVEWRWDPAAETGAADPAGLLALFTCGRSGTYCDPGYDDLFRAQAVTLAAERRAELLRRMQVQLLEDLPFLPVYHPYQLDGYRSDRFTNLASPRSAGDWGREAYLRATPVVPDGELTGRQGAQLLAAGIGAMVVLFTIFTVAFRRRVPPAAYRFRY